MAELTREHGPARARRSCSTTTSTAACGRRRSSSSPPSPATSCRPATPSRSDGGSPSPRTPGSLERYLETFDHTVAVMQTAEDLTRVARECVEDLAADGVVYAEVRYAPEQHLEGGLSLEEVVDAVQRGFDEGAGRGERARSWCASCSPRCGTRRTPGRSPSWSSRTATTGWSASTSPAPRPATRRPGTWTPSSTSSARTRTSPSTPARRSGCRRSGRRSSGAAPTGSVTASGSSTTSPSATDGGRDARSAGGVRPRQADPAGAVPALQRADRRRRLDRRAPDRAADPAAVPGHGQHRQPADERHLDDPRDGRTGRGVRLRRSTTCSGSP